MSGIEWILPAARELYKSRDDVSNIWERITTRVAGKKMTIAVTGLPGVGKTVMFDYLTGRAYKRGYRPPNDPSRKPDRGRVPAKGFRIELATIPGQDALPRTQALEQIFEGKRPVDGVIHVVANGFVASRNRFTIESLVDSGVTTIDKFRQHQLANELDDLRQTASTSVDLSANQESQDG